MNKWKGKKRDHFSVANEKMLDTNIFAIYSKKAHIAVVPQ